MLLYTYLCPMLACHCEFVACPSDSYPADHQFQTSSLAGSQHIKKFTDKSLYTSQVLIMQLCTRASPTGSWLLCCMMVVSMSCISSMICSSRHLSAIELRGKLFLIASIFGDISHDVTGSGFVSIYTCT